MTQNKFSISRAAQLTLLYISENRRFLLLSAATVLGVSLILSLSCLIDTSTYDIHHYNHPGQEYDPCFDVIKMWYIFALAAFACVGASMMFSDLSAKQGRIHMLMMPANASEKFLSRWIVYVLLLPLVVIACMFFAESLRCFFLNLNPHEAAVIPVYKVFSDPSLLDVSYIKYHPVIGPAVWIAGYLMLQSFFVVGSTLWPKASFVKTFALFAALTAIITGITVWWAVTITRGLYLDGSSFIQDHIMGIFFTLECVAILFNWGMAWMRLRETDVITTKR